MRRTIMIFPEFDNMEVIDHIRERFDPLAHAVRPHITLVFPFESDMSNEELTRILHRRLASVKSFDLCLGGFSRHIDDFGYTLFLDVLQGGEEICRINRLLYDHEFMSYDAGYPYIPHMTVGKLDNKVQLDHAYESIRRLPDRFTATVKRISVEEIGVNEESLIVIEHEIV